MVVHGCLRINRCKFERFPEQTTSWEWHWNKVNGSWMKYDESKAIEMHWVPAKLKVHPSSTSPWTINPQPSSTLWIRRCRAYLFFSSSVLSVVAAQTQHWLPTPTSSHRDPSRQKGTKRTAGSWHALTLYDLIILNLIHVTESQSLESDLLTAWLCSKMEETIIRLFIFFKSGSSSGLTALICILSIWSNAFNFECEPVSVLCRCIPLDLPVLLG